MGKQRCGKYRYLLGSSPACIAYRRERSHIPDQTNAPASRKILNQQVSSAIKCGGLEIRISGDDFVGIAIQNHPVGPNLLSKGRVARVPQSLTAHCLASVG